jgi:hypothetical protein
MSCIGLRQHALCIHRRQDSLSLHSSRKVLKSSAFLHSSSTFLAPNQQVLCCLNDPIINPSKSQETRGSDSQFLTSSGSKYPSTVSPASQSSIASPSLALALRCTPSTNETAFFIDTTGLPEGASSPGPTSNSTQSSSPALPLAQTTTVSDPQTQDTALDISIDQDNNPTRIPASEDLSNLISSTQVASPSLLPASHNKQ